MQPEKKIIRNHMELEYLSAYCRKEGSKIALTSGAFDLMHDGHPKYLLAARKQADKLIVGIDNDDFVRSQKGQGRPILDQERRAYIIACFEFVHHVFFLHCKEDTIRAIKLVKPNAFVTSASTHTDFNRAEQYRLVESMGGVVVKLPPMADIHTTGIIEKIKGL